MKRIFSIFCIIFLIGITSAVPYYSTSYFVYADDGLSDQQKAALAMSSYFNYRKGWYVGSAAGAVGVMKSYIDDFFNDSANNTGINSFSEFASHIDVGKNSSGNWGVSIDNTGLVFLDHLCKWLLGKNKFPNLYSGGAWGQNISATSDDLYNGYLNGDSLFYILDFDISNSVIGEVNPNKVIVGTPVKGMYGNLLFDQYNTYSPGIDWNTMTMPIPSSYKAQTITIEYTVNYSKNLTIRYSYADSSVLQPYLAYNEYYGSGYTSEACRCVYSKKGNKVVGCPAFLMSTYNGTNTFYYGWISYDATNNKYYYKRFGEYNRNDAISNSTQVNIDFNTDNFDKNDVGQADSQGQPVQDAPSKTFTPKYTSDQGDTYNYYTNETVNNFYNEYITNYVTKNTVINNNDSGGGSNNDPYPLDPENPSDPGGTIPDWSGNGDSGTITPDGNGGYTFQLPDFSLPDLDINWSISGLAEKFPFSIPFDLYALFTVLNAEPETPELHGEIPIWTYTWEIDWDLHQFDSIAALMRNLEFIAFCIGLALITRNIIRG